MRKKELPHTPQTAALMAKYRKQLLLTTVSAVVSIGVIAGATAAWFASNRKVDSTGMSAKVQITSNLIIAEKPSLLKSNPSAIAQFAAGAVSLKPCRHIGYGIGPDQAEGTNLYYNQNPEDVTIGTGLGGQQQLTFAPVPTDQKDEYYIDFYVYIASMGNPITAEKLNVSMTAVPDPSTDEKYKHLNAATIDVYIGSDYLTGGQTTGAYTYAGTVNAAGKNWITSVALPDGHVTLSTSGSITFPDVNDANAAHTYTDPDGGTAYPCVPVLLRCYFDGGLLETLNTATTSEKAYINSLETSEMVDCKMSISFTAIEQQ